MTIPSKHVRRARRNFFIGQQKEVSRAGFTLIEVLLYAGLTAFIFSSAVLVVYTIIEGSARDEKRIRTDEEAHFILRKIDWALGDVIAIGEPAPGASSSKLSVAKADFAANPIMLGAENGAAWISKGGGDRIPLTGPQVLVTNFVFEHVAATATRPAAVKTHFEANGRPYASTRYLRQ